MATMIAISCATLTTWTTTLDGSSPIYHASPCNLSGLKEHGAATTSIINLMALVDAAARDRKKLQDMENTLLAVRMEFMPYLRTMYIRR